MLIEPVPLTPRGRRWRLRTLAAAALPALAVAAVVATSVLVEERTDGHERAATTVVEAPQPSAAVANASAPVTGATPGATTALTIAIPRRSLGLPAHSVSAVLEARRDDELDDRLIAIRGHLTLTPSVEACVVDDAPDAGSPAATPWLCQRLAILRDAAKPMFTVAGGLAHWNAPSGEPYLATTVFPGVSLGPLDAITALDPATAASERWFTPHSVIVIGRFDDPRVSDPRSTARHVNETFVIERLVWADGSWQDHRVARLPPSRASGLDPRGASAVATTALAGGTVILSQNVVGIATLAELAPDALAAVRADVEADDRLWYIRAMSRPAPPVDTLADDGGARRLGWAVIATDGRILAVRPDD